MHTLTNRKHGKPASLDMIVDTYVTLFIEAVKAAELRKQSNNK